MPPEPRLPKFSTNTNAGLAHSTPAPPAPVFVLPGSRSIPTQPPTRRTRSDRAPIAQPVISAASTQPLDSPVAPPMVMTPSAPPVQPAPLIVMTPSAPPATPAPPQVTPSAYPAWGQAGAAGGSGAPIAPSPQRPVSPAGVIGAVAAAIVAALATVSLMVWLTQPSPSKPARVSAPEPAAASQQPRAGASLSAPAASTAPPVAQGSAATAPSASAGSSSLAELAAKGDLDACMQIRARKPEDRTAQESLALARGESVRKRAGLDELARRLRSDLPLSADRENLRKLREYLDDGETVTDALGVLTSLGTPMAADMLFDVGQKAPERSDTRGLVDDLLASKEVRGAASSALAVVLDLREVQTCDDAWRLLPRAIENADRRALPGLERLRVRTGCGRYKAEDCYRCLRGTDDLDKAIRAASGRVAPGI